MLESVVELIQWNQRGWEEMIDTRTIDRNSLYPRLTNIYVEFKLMIENNDVLTLIEKLY